MKTAQDYRQAAQQITEMADRLRPALAEETPYANARNEAVVYLRLAASKARAIAADIAHQEKS